MSLAHCLRKLKLFAAAPAAFLLVLAPCAAQSGVAQSERALSFDVASVRASKEAPSSSNVPLGPGNVYSPSHGILSARNFPLLTYLVFAYKLTDYQQEAIRSAGPEWVIRDGYSIEARTEKADVTKDELRLMMRSLLADRFKLTIHSEKRQVRAFALVPIKPGTLGPKLRVHPSGASCVDPSFENDRGGRQYGRPSRAAGQGCVPCRMQRHSGSDRQR